LPPIEENFREVVFSMSRRCDVNGSPPLRFRAVTVSLLPRALRQGEQKLAKMPANLGLTAGGGPANKRYFYPVI
jgi:hypothetical protein